MESQSLDAIAESTPSEEILLDRVGPPHESGAKWGEMKASSADFDDFDDDDFDDEFDDDFEEDWDETFDDEDEEDLAFGDMTACTKLDDHIFDSAD